MAQHLYANDLMDHRLQHRSCQFQQLVPCQFDEIPSFLRRRRPGQLPFGHSQNTLQADHQEIFDQVYANLLRSPSQVFLLEANDPLADGCFAFC